MDDFFFLSQVKVRQDRAIVFQNKDGRLQLSDYGVLKTFTHFSGVIIVGALEFQ